MNKFVCLKCKELGEKPTMPDVLTQENLWIVSAFCEKCYKEINNETNSK